jgi:peptidoglycan/LPS O-acetylase OafA/YrhL
MDATRAVAAVLVVFSHVRDLVLRDYAGNAGAALKAFYFVTGFGHIGVIVFFVLSGYWISRSVIRRANDPAFWPDYLVDRLSRLWIVLVPALLIGGILDGIGLHLGAPLYTGATGARSIDPADVASTGWWTLSANLIFLQSLVVPTFGSNGPLWSLAYEFWYYFWFPALWLLLRHRRLSPALLALGMGIAAPMLAFGFVSWMCGAALHAAVGWSERRAAPSRYLAFAVAGSGLLATVAAVILLRLHPAWWLDPVLAFSFAWLMLGICLIAPGRLHGLAQSHITARDQASRSMRCTIRLWRWSRPGLRWAAGCNPMRVVSRWS